MRFDIGAIQDGLYIQLMEVTEKEMDRIVKIQPGCLGVPAVFCVRKDGTIETYPRMCHE
jgi:hypothetical protein